MKTISSPDPDEPSAQKWLFLTFFLLLSLTMSGQQKHMIQLKTFDQQLAPYKNTEVSINNKPFVTIGNKGTAFTELEDSDFPIKSVLIKNDQFEAASWNYTKGTLEIIIRKKSYTLVQVVVRDQLGNVLPNLKVVFGGKKPMTLTTNAEGKFEVPIGLDERMTSNLFTIPDIDRMELRTADGSYQMTVHKPVPVVAEIKTEPVQQKPQQAKDYIRDFDFSKLDSIQSLTVFYAIFKNYQISGLDERTKQRMDAKFNQLVKQLEDSLLRKATPVVGRISDSSFVNDDIRTLVQQAQLENQLLETQRTDFDERIRVIQEKLNSGIANMDPATRSKLLSDLTILERLLEENESRFYKNQSYYRDIIDALRNKLDVGVKDLEDRLTESEKQRLEEQEVFQQRLMVILGIALVFGVMIILLISFSNALRKQKKALELANTEIKRINENLEGLVYQRTQSLAEANKELDTFLYRASHDLRSPVCSIVGLCNIASHVANQESKDLIHKMTGITVNMDRLLKKLSIISEINHPTNYAETSLREVFQRSLHDFQKIVVDRDISVSLDCDPELSFYTYPNLIEVILTNLVENAIFYSTIKSGRKGHIKLEGKLRGDVVDLIVEDNGIGIEESIRPRVYDMFFKGNELSKGNGLGLYIVMKSVVTLEGEIRVDSESGKYTRFHITLPLTTSKSHLHPAEVEEAVLV
jgi:signal transduction histidine kinase